MKKRIANKLNTRKIRRQLELLGFTSFQVEFDVCTASHPQPHIRVTAWHASLSHDSEFDCGKLWVMGEGKKLQTAWNAVLYYAKHANYGFAGGFKPR
jgi:hypothetical protein